MQKIIKFINCLNSNQIGDFLFSIWKIQMTLNKFKKMWPFAAFAGLFWDKPGLNERLALARA
jgi:hypothetical protein